MRSFRCDLAKVFRFAVAVAVEVNDNVDVNASERRSAEVSDESEAAALLSTSPPLESEVPIGLAFAMHAFATRLTGSASRHLQR